MTAGTACIIPTYNRREFVVQAIESALAQSVPFSEVLIVDDGSTDETYDALQQFGSAIRIIRQTNQGVTAARHHGVLASAASHIMFLDSDDRVEPEWHEAHQRARTLCPAARLTLCNHRTLVNGQQSRATKFDEAPAGYWKGLTCLAPGMRLLTKPMYDLLLRWQPVMVGTFLVSREDYLRIGGYDPAKGRWPSEDFEFALRLVHLAPTVVIEKPLFLYRRHGQQATSDVIRFVAGDARILEYSLKHHPLGQTHRDEIADEISRRSAAVFDHAFSNRDAAMLAEHWTRVRPSHRTAKRYLKRLLSSVWS